MGKGSGAKLVLNSLLGIFGEAYAEAMLMGEQFGIDLNELAEAIGGSAMNSPMFQTKSHCYSRKNSQQHLCSNTQVKISTSLVASWKKQI
ncbi:3-hydroxyacid dehydrogenase [Actinobacillus equuli]|nr:3-hydroxyacid dehydrogenase [Actinobacillus equuli]